MPYLADLLGEARLVFLKIQAFSIGPVNPGQWNSCGQKTGRGPNPPEQSRFLFLIDVSVSAAFN